MGVTGKGDQRHAHVKRLASGGRASVRERIEGDIDLMRCTCSRNRSACSRVIQLESMLA